MDSNLALVIVSIISALGAIIGPIVTQCMNQKHDLKVKSFDAFNSNKVEVIHNYLERISNFAPSRFVEEDSPLYLIYLYVPQEIHADLDEINDYINGRIVVNDIAYRQKVLEIAKILAPIIYS